MNKNILTRRKEAFTLIELLVVIAIISLLVSILLPSLNVAKDLAKSVLCQANLRGLGTSLLGYASESEGVIHIFQWPTRLKDADWVDESYVHEKNDRAGLFNCPSLPFSSVERWQGDYAMAYLFWDLYPKNDPTQPSFFLPFDDLKNAASSGMLTEARYDFNYTSACVGNIADNWSEKRWLRNPHNKSLNLFYCDGHAENFKAEYDTDMGYDPSHVWDAVY